MQINLFRETWTLLKKEAVLEWRTKNSIQAILIYALSTVFVCYWALHTTEPPVWNALFWVIMVFSSINAAAKSFMQENQARQLYLFTMASPQAMFISKLIFSSVIMVVLTLCSIFLYSLLLGFPVIYPDKYLLCLVMGALNLSAIFTLLSSIASRAGNNMTLLSILGLPLVLPVIFILIRFSASTLMGAVLMSGSRDLIALAMLYIIIVGTSLLVFPYIWRD